ncbi:CDP-glycerol glycerophosphotransferase family protein [Ligilactobacillus acidipiscis]|uniref:bifunctional glycosyltransferase/CDP-glycerol:glycerophosphate glycerophosphotransferase n=1 Tax=Ligilactobacillus acidipiscis TaxID=89059 RepID=UPI0038644B26
MNKDISLLSEKQELKDNLVLPDKYLKNEFLYSIIMATYNVAPYIDDSMESLENQLLDFESNVQVIFVNDGSTDNSLEVVQRWQRKYPKNVFIINQKNAGVSAARNAGIEAATGKYINFLDPDDMLDSGVLLRLNFFFKKHPEVKIAHIPLYTFEAKNEPHNLNKLFTKDEEIVDIEEHSNKIFAHISSSFFLRELFSDETLRFEVGRKYGEDLALVAKLVEREKKFALINNFFYRYRARDAGDSAMDNSRSDSATYIPNLKMMLELIHENKKDGKIDKWLQTVIMYDLAWKIRRDELPFEKPENFDQNYWSLVHKVLQYIDEEKIRSVGHLKWVQKEALIYFMYSGKLPSVEGSIGIPVPLINDVKLINGEKEYYLSNVNSNVYIFKYRPDTDSINIVGTIDHLFGKKSLTITATDGYQTFTSELLNEPSRIKLIGNSIHSIYTYSFDIPVKLLRNSEYIKIEVNFNNVCRPLKIKFAGMLVSVGNNIKSNYVFAGAKLLRFNFEKLYFEVKENNLKNLTRFENDLIAKLESKKGISLERKARLIYLRKLALQSKISSKVINIFEDRPNKADDNAEVFYKYVDDKHPEWDNYFILQRDSVDWERLEKQGYTLVEYGSKKHEELLIQAQNLISSQASLTEMRPWPKNFGYLRDAYHYNFVFLQHGVTKHDLSLWLRKIEKDIRLLVTVSEQEKQGFLDYGYEYTPQEVKVTGFPRFDRFSVDFSNSKENGKILIAPTWRNGIWQESDTTEVKIEKLKETEFYQNWQKLLFSGYIKSLVDQGNNVSLMLHPLLREVEDGFEVPSYINNISFETRYVDVLKATDLLITDFSSIYFDIAYQGKPTLYYQFDNGNDNNKKGYFDFDTMGFGPVCSDIEGLNNELKKIVRNKYRMTDIYQQRVHSFFKYTDSENSKRLDGEISDLMYRTQNNKEKNSISYSLKDIESLYNGYKQKVFTFKTKIKKYVKKD